MFSKDQVLYVSTGSKSYVVLSSARKICIERALWYKQKASNKATIQPFYSLRPHLLTWPLLDPERFCPPTSISFYTALWGWWLEDFSPPLRPKDSDLFSETKI